MYVDWGVQAEALPQTVTIFIYWRFLANCGAACSDICTEFTAYFASFFPTFHSRGIRRLGTAQLDYRGVSFDSN